MAKSSHSKHLKRLHAIKRVRYAKRELDRLQATLAKAQSDEASGANAIPNGLMVTKPRYYQKLLKEIEEKNQKMEEAKPEETKESNEESESAEDKMETESRAEATGKKRNRMGKNGNYPSWVSRKNIRKYRKARNKQKTQAKKSKAKGKKK